MKQAALITGASSGIGMAIAEQLLREDWEVFGIGRDFSGCDLVNHESFHAWKMDLLEEEALRQALTDLPKDRLTLLVNNAGAAWYGPHETIGMNEIQTMVRTNLEVPMILSGLLLRTLRDNHGMIINIASITALHTSTHGAVYGALKAGLLHFSRTLLEENRKSGLRVTAILPDMTDTKLYRNASFKADTEFGASLSPDQVAQAVMCAIHQPEGSLISELVLEPQLHRIRKK